jgi:hypothetical protein
MGDNLSERTVGRAASCQVFKCDGNLKAVSRGEANAVTSSGDRNSESRDSELESPLGLPVRQYMKCIEY